jgi:hypothetical protein
VETKVAMAMATGTRRLFLKKSRFIFVLRNAELAARQHARQYGRANWHDFGRCQKKINRPLIEATLGSEGGNRELRFPSILRGVERLG